MSNVTRSQTFPIARHASRNLPEFAGSKERNAPEAVNSISCRQFYVSNGYSFSREESVGEKAKNCFAKIKDRVTSSATFGKIKDRLSFGGGSRMSPYSGRSYRSMVRARERARERSMMVKRFKEETLASLRSVVQRLLSCTTRTTTSVDVVHHK